jgi:uncharacterized protein (DUF1499 family)
MFVVVLVGVMAVLAAAVIYIRTVGHDPAVWHVDPLTALEPLTPNSFYVGPAEGSAQAPDAEARIYAVAPQDLARAFDNFVMGQPRVEFVAESEDKLWVTYVQRTERLQVPDYISVRFLPYADGLSTISIFSRSRFGHGDMGVNAARVTAWLAALDALAADSATIEAAEAAATRAAQEAAEEAAKAEEAARAAEAEAAAAAAAAQEEAATAAPSVDSGAGQIDFGAPGADPADAAPAGDVAGTAEEPTRQRSLPQIDAAPSEGVSSEAVSSEAGQDGEVPQTGAPGADPSTEGDGAAVSSGSGPTLEPVEGEPPVDDGQESEGVLE